MLNTSMLLDKIEKSGLKRSYIAQKLGITRAGFHKKLKGETEFTLKEVSVLCTVLGVSNLSEKERIFFAKK